MANMDSMRKHKPPFDLEMAEAVTTLLGIVVLAFVAMYVGVIAIEWLMEFR